MAFWEAVMVHYKEGEKLLASYQKAVAEDKTLSTCYLLEGHRTRLLSCEPPQFSFIWGKRRYFNSARKATALPLPVLSCFCSRRKGYWTALPIHSKITTSACDSLRAQRNLTFTEKKQLRGAEVMMNEMSFFLALTWKT